MLGPAGHHDNGILLKHLGMEDLWLELIAVISVAQDEVFSEAPGVDLPLVAHHSVAIVTGGLYLSAHFSLFVGIVPLGEVQLPELVYKLWSVKVVNVL